ncbi:hypothetical protein cand_003600 [Cryptosporidium andersoni]|uniref:Uncharacterized protein n=1 Tax=Cryptosporidium andersoni TaxID=117008 RepID=A0A1J4MML4_9CRYT|nr:hypothetical protein cand_003600 [Cryptosporidium andersoni]
MSSSLGSINNLTEEETKNLSEEQNRNTSEQQNLDWVNKCCCTWRIKFENDTSNLDNSNININEQSERVLEFRNSILNQVDNIISGYRRQSILDSISEFEDKLLTIGIGDDKYYNSSDSENSDSEEQYLRGYSDFIKKPNCIIDNNRRVTSPKYISNNKVDIKENKEND